MAVPPQRSDPPEEPSLAERYPRIAAVLGTLRRWGARDAREFFWDGLDFLDQRPKLKLGLLAGVPVAILVAATALWGYSRWSRTHAIVIGRQWLAAGRLDRAEIAVRDALKTEPDAPGTWQLAADLAWARGMKTQAVTDLRKAANLSHGQPEAIIAWAEAALLADDNDEAGKALSFLASDDLSRSSRAERTQGEWLRRKRSYVEAAERFKAARELDRQASLPSLAIDEVPLGVTLLATGRPGDHERGIGLLTQWSGDPHWGADALRELLADAIRRNDPVAMPRWAEALSQHPRFSVGDIYDCLRGTAAADPARFQAMLGAIKQASGSDPQRVAQVMGSLNQLGRTAETLAWAKIIPFPVSQRPPIAVAVAEALRQNGRWRELDEFVDRCDWGHDLDFLHSLYSLIAARQLGDSAKAQARWKTVQTDTRWNGGQAVVAADLLYGWGASDEAITLLWAAAQNPRFAVQALGTLARIYQVRRDADGQYRAFARLASLRPEDRDIGNNFAYFAALVSQGNIADAGRVAQANFEAAPENLHYLSTWAFVLCRLARAGEALEVLEPVATANWRTSPAVAWAYGTALAETGRKDEAKAIFHSINPDTLSFQEIDWVRQALK